MKRIVVCIFILFSLLPIRYAYAVKIVAIVNDDVITDVDVDDFEKILCKLDKRFKCGSQNSRQLALISLAESTLKLEHFRQIKIIDDEQINGGFKEYRNNVLREMKIRQNNIPEAFEMYLKAEYIWGIMISSQVRNEKITDNDIKQFMKNKKLSNVGAEKVRQMILQEKMENLSQQTMAELKKFYLIDIKGL